MTTNKCEGMFLGSPIHRELVLVDYKKQVPRPLWVGVPGRGRTFTMDVSEIKKMCQNLTVIDPESEKVSK